MSDIWLTIVLAGAGTYALRASFLAVAGHLDDLGVGAQRVLRQIPPAVLASLVALALLRPEGSVDLWQPRLLAGLVAGVVSWRSRSVALTLAVGMGVLVIVERL